MVVGGSAYAGGMAPGAPGPGVKLSGPTINGSMVVDTHDQLASPTLLTQDGAALYFKNKIATIQLQRGGRSASAIFTLPAVFATFSGCDATLTSARFAFDESKTLNNGLRNWIPGPTVNKLLEGLGIATDPAVSGEPVITAISAAGCTEDADNPVVGLGLPGILSFQFNAQFVKP